MGNIVKFNSGVKSANSIKSGTFDIGVNSTPTDLTGFYTGISPINGGYTIYIDKASGGPSIYAPKDDATLINIVKTLGASVSTATDALVWINSQSNMTVVNNNYPSIVTDGLVLNLDAGFVSSYPKTGTTWRDLSGNGNNGTLVNGVGFSGGSMVFDGVDDYISITKPNSIFLNYTISFWVKLTNDFNTGTISRLYVSSMRGSGTHTYLYFQDGRFIYRTYGPTDNLTSNKDSWASDKWYYVTCVLSNGVNKSLYINGSIDSQYTLPSNANLAFTSTFELGRLYTSADYLNGNISNFKIYDKSLTPQEILQNYYAGLQRFIPTDGLVLSLDAQNTNLYATSPTTVYDVSGNENNGTLINGTQYVGDGDGSWNFDSVDDYIDNIGTTSSFSFIQNTGIFTICAWVRLTEFSTTQRAIMGNNRNVTTEKGFLLARGTASSRIRFVITNGGGNVFSQQWDNYFLDNNWVFVTIVGNGTNVIYYRNGTLFQNGSNLGTLATGDSTRTLSVGRVTNLSSSFFWSGNISQTSIYNTTLSATQISTIYNATKSRYGIQ